MIDYCLYKCTCNIWLSRFDFLVVCSYSTDILPKCLVFKPCALFSITCSSRLSFIFLSNLFYILIFCSEVIATKIIRSPSQTGWLVDSYNIYPFLKWPWIFSILHRFFFKEKEIFFLYHQQYVYWTWLYIVLPMRPMSYKKQELRTIFEQMDSLQVFW